MNNRTVPRQQFSRAEITKVLARYRQSGLGLAEFAREQGIPPGRLHYWIYHKGRPRRSEPQRVSPSKPMFQELEVASLLPANESWTAEVTLPGGLVIRFNQKATPEWIGPVVQALRRPC